MLFLKERIPIVSWKQDSKTYDEMCQLYQRRYGKQPPKRANIRLLVIKFTRTDSVADGKHPRRPSNMRILSKDFNSINSLVA
ncbi:hypothetical protein TNCT_358321 [Trichonephila clavata]|uniref:DUF4817 domain-containing protein n=1 Tax=Trichonephila clavata TaxID=2740835 RepID=A0A8X6GCN9_TRICU|nr:hypothetical protein TNCT_358321 [Trichonephila clavata]